MSSRARQAQETVRYLVLLKHREPGESQGRDSKDRLELHCGVAFNAGRGVGG